MVRSALEITSAQHTKDIDKIATSMERMITSIDGLRDDMSQRSERYLQAMNDHQVEDSNRFGKLETKMALYVGMGMCFAAFARDIIIGINSVVSH